MRCVVVAIGDKCGRGTRWLEEKGKWWRRVAEKTGLLLLGQKGWTEASLKLEWVGAGEHSKIRIILSCNYCSVAGMRKSRLIGKGSSYGNSREDFG